MTAPYGMRVFVSGQGRGVTLAVKRELRRRSAVEPVIGHLKSDHRLAVSTGVSFFARRMPVGQMFASLEGVLYQ